MSAVVEILVYDKGATELKLVHQTAIRGPTELGRQKSQTEILYSTTQLASGRWRLVIAPLSEQSVGRDHALLELLPDGQIQLTNTSSRSTIRLENGVALARHVPATLTIPPGGLLMALGARMVRLQQAWVEEPDLSTLPQATTPPGTLTSLSRRFPALALPTGPGIDTEMLIRWLQEAMLVLQSAANASDFLQKAAQAVVDLVGTDAGRALLLEKCGWQQSAVALQEAVPPALAASWQPSQSVLSKVCAEKKTFWEISTLSERGSTRGVQAVVAAPILNRNGEVIGALYGERRQPGGRPITQVEAMLVELLACGVASGLARLEQELTALRFEQFFTPQLARQLAEQPDLLQGREALVTLLFVDVRGFSRVSERLGPVGTVAWISDVMAQLSDCVLAHQGVLVDYIGDELMAMWGAPEEQPEHARLACRAALAMLDLLPALNAKWQPVLGELMEYGMGINSGNAHVGNTGSPRKFKYGPLGNTVNLASRVQGATKHFKTRLLITAATHAYLDAPLRARARRMGTVRVVNIKEPVTLYELAASDQPPEPIWKPTYEQALEAFEQKNFRVAARTLAPLIAEQVNDPPSIVLLSRAVQGLAEGAAPDHPVWDLLTK